MKDLLNKYFLDFNNPELTNISIQIEKLQEKIQDNPLEVKQEIEQILEKNIDYLKGNIIKISLFETKLEAINLLGGIKELIETFNEIQNIIFNEINFSFNEKQNQEEKIKLFIEELEKKYLFLSQNFWKVFDEKGNINKKLYFQFINIFFNDIKKLKEFNKQNIAIYNLSNFYNFTGQIEKYKKLLKILAHSGNKEAIEQYTNLIIYNFLENLKKLKTIEKKQKFIENNLENFEEDIFQFVDDFHYDNNGNRIKSKQGGNKYLYEKLGDFYSKIGLILNKDYIRYFQYALDAYNSGIQSSYRGSYKLFEKIAELYKNYKYKIPIFNKKQINELIKFNYYTSYQFSSLNQDYKKAIESLITLSDLNINNSQERLKNIGTALAIISKEISENQSTFAYEKLALILEKLNLEQINIISPNTQNLYSKESLYSYLATINPEYYINLGVYYEQKNNIQQALFSYLNNIAYNSYYDRNKQELNNISKNSINAFLIFLETTLINFKNKEIGKLRTEIFDKKEEIKILEKKYEPQIIKDENKYELNKLEDEDDEKIDKILEQNGLEKNLQKKGEIKQYPKKIAKKILTPQINKLKYEIKILEGNIKQLEFEKEIIRKIIEIIDKEQKISFEDIKEIFGLTLDSNFFENLSFKKIIPFINMYKQEPFSNLYLTKVLEEIEFLFGFDKKILKPFFTKINNNEKLDEYDYEDLKDILENALNSLENYNHLLEE